MVVAMSLWGRSLGTLGPRQTMVYAYFEPVSAVIIAAVLLGEALRPIQAVGALLTFAGVWLGSGGRPER
jgi:probable blue pigment (indigoidine) exporter